MITPEVVTALTSDHSQLNLAIVDEPQDGEKRDAGPIRFDQLSPELCVEIYTFDVKDGKRGICVLTRVGKVRRAA